MIWRNLVRPRLPVIHRRWCGRHWRRRASLDRNPVIPLATMSSSRLLLLVFLLHLAVSQRFASSFSSPKVSLALYYETLCPYSANFIVNYLAKIFDDGLISIVDVDLVPYGNARIQNGTISCQVPFAIFSDRFQHGPYECLLNTVEACAIDAWPDLVTRWFVISYHTDVLIFARYDTVWAYRVVREGVPNEASVMSLPRQRHLLFSSSPQTRRRGGSNVVKASPHLRHSTKTSKATDVFGLQRRMRRRSRAAASSLSTRSRSLREGDVGSGHIKVLPLLRSLFLSSSFSLPAALLSSQLDAQDNCTNKFIDMRLGHSKVDLPICGEVSA
ncbi:hypothetical protein GW17_00026455 [Ensete ventricosum]|nr:hypothetical protein GW17_00026455 [Ensete ventricosum]